MFVDHAKIHVISGRGGPGSISFRREKYVPRGGPDGGNGGRGGNVTLRVHPHVRTLLDCREVPRYRAQNGRPGSGNNKTGRDAEDLEINLPRGTMVRDAATGEVVADLVGPDDTFVAARGGRGGRGNAMFATPTHQAPRRADPGEDGEERWFELELKLIADVGLVGPPNAGKSTLLSRITRARPRVADYPFTTLEPHLGIVRLDEERSFVVADLPGLIEGAHEGRGLGLQFLRHVERTSVIALLVDASTEHAAAEAETIRHELGSYSTALLEKPSVTVLTKADLLPPEQHAGRPAEAGLPDAMLISAHSGEGMAALLERLWTLMPAPEVVERDDG